MTAPRAPWQQRRVGPAGRAALELLALCPRIPTDVVGVLLGHAHPVSTAQLLGRLRRTGLVQYQQVMLGPLLGTRAVRLWTLTAVGRAFVGARKPSAPQGQAGRMPYGEPERWRDPARQHGIPLVVACYRLLAEVASGLERPLRVCAWEYPWIRTVAPAEGGRTRRVRLPAAATLYCGQIERTRPVPVLLLPDVGTTPLASHRTTLQALSDLRRKARVMRDNEALLVVGVATSSRLMTARVQAWRSLLLDVAARAHDRPLAACVVALQQRLRSGHLYEGRRPRRSAATIDELFGLVARHPLLSRRQLATLLRTSTWRIDSLEEELIDRGWIRPLAGHDTPGNAQAPERVEIERLGLVEITTSGGKEAARRLLVPAGLARGQHGVISSDARPRRFLRHLHHTLGTNAVFVAFVSAARRSTERGGDEALEEWRSAAACARGRFRPDGYGCYRRQATRFGFLVEFDRGTEKTREYAAKLDAYYRYRASTAAKHAYAGFPTVLVVTTRAAAEARFALQAYLAEERHRSTRLPIFLTTTGHIEASPEGVLGPIWRSTGDPWAAEPMRLSWLPRRHHQLGTCPSTVVGVAAK